MSANSQPSRALAKLEMKPPLGVPLSATNRLPGFTRRLSWVTKSIGVSGNDPGSAQRARHLGNGPYRRAHATLDANAAATAS